MFTLIRLQLYKFIRCLKLLHDNHLQAILLLSKTIDLLHFFIPTGSQEHHLLSIKVIPIILLMYACLC